MHFSVDYGYGLLNAFTAVRMAEVWNRFSPVAATSANERVVTAGPLDVGLAIPDLSVAEYSFTVSESIVLEHVDLTLSLTHQYFTDLRINLISPAGTDLTLFDGSTGNGALADFGFSYSFGAGGYLGENSAGQWTLRIRDARAQDAGTLDALQFSGYGASPSADDVYHYTDEILAVMALPGQASRLTLVDPDGGTDWVNASAMSRNLVLSLAAGATSSLAGTSFMAVGTGTLLEHAIAGDGDDVLFGNDLDNQLFGMRGDDRIDGGAGTDTAVFLGTSAQYQITQTGGVVTVTNLAADFGSDRLTNIEWIRFDDTVVEITSGSVNDIFAPLLLATAPTDGAGDVLAAANLVFTFDESIQALAGAVLIYRADGSLWRRIETSDTTQVQITANQLTVNSLVDLEPGQRYYVLVEAGSVADLVGNPFGGITDSTRLDFTVVSDLVTRTGTALADTMTGGASHDLLFGLGGNDALAGQAGNDTLDGGAGQDALTGGLGDDVYLVDDSRDRVTESSNQGTDKVIVSVLSSYTLPSNFEHLVRSGGGNFTGNGTAAANALTGGTGNDALNGNGGDDILQGLGGNDVLRGGVGRDELHGGVGTDRFVFSSVAEAGLGATRDVIADLLTGDRIDLSAIDANSSSRGDQAFSSTLVGGFTGARAQLQVTQATGHVIVAGDIDGNRVADFEIQILGRTSLSAADFIL
jgi:Ca2+-binding RTX toxin-like protein